MLTHLQIKNFKAWRDTGRMKLAPLTVIFGANSSGKSSLGHWLLALKQTASHSDRKCALYLGDEHAPVDLGLYKDCVYGHNLQQDLEFTLGWSMPQPLEVSNALNSKETYQGKQLELSATLHADDALQPRTRQFSYRLKDDDERETLFVRHGYDEKSKDYVVESRPLRLARRQGRGWGAESPEKFYRFSDRTLSRFENADFLAEFALETERVLEHVYYLGPLRNHPRRIYSWSGDMPRDVGAQGEYAIQALLAASERTLNRRKGQKVKFFKAFIADWLKDLGVIDTFSVQPIADGRKEYEVLIRTHPDLPEVKLTDVGFGMSQILPVLVQAFYAPANSVVWMEQPEMHLHPSVQANLADMFISAVQSTDGSGSKDAVRNVQFIIESHSEHFLNRLQRRVAEEQIRHLDVAIYFVDRDRQGAHLAPLRLNRFGEIENWPHDFFGDEMNDIAERVLAGIQRKKMMDHD